MRIYIDFESRSQADIWQTGAWRYAEDPTTEILCLCYAIDDLPVVSLQYGPQLRKSIAVINRYIQEGAEFHAHNAYFERCIWKQKMIPVYGALAIPLKQWRCTAAKCSAHGLPKKLEHAALALDCKHKKNMTGNRLMLALAASRGIIEQEKLNRLMQYCCTDVEVEREIDTMLPDLCPGEQQVWYFDQRINDNGVAIDTKAVHNAVKIIVEEKKKLNEELHQLTGGEIDAGTQTQAVRKFLEKRGVSLPDLTKGTVKKALTEAGGNNLRILQLRQQISLTSIAKYQTLETAASADGRLRDLLVYHGASTGRWSGKLFQIQNLAKPSEVDFNNVGPIALLRDHPESFGFVYDGNILPNLSSCIRGMLIPSPGREMLIADFAAIEARVVLWLAEETNGVKLFQQQDADPALPDIYVHMARAIYGNPRLTKKDKKERMLGKQTVLGCGFGMGVDKFIDTCAKYDIEISRELAERSVGAYRRTFKKVVNFWYAMEAAARETIVSKKPHQIGRLLWYIDGDFLRMKLPIGRTLAYHHPRIDGEGSISYLAENATTHKYIPEKTWGGKLVENAVQAVARDIMVEAMFRAERVGFTTLFTVHDEVVAEAATGSKTVEDMLEVMRTVPSWAVGCPINAECEKVERYKK